MDCAFPDSPRADKAWLRDASDGRPGKVLTCTKTAKSDPGNNSSKSLSANCRNGIPRRPTIGLGWQVSGIAYDTAW